MSGHRKIGGAKLRWSDVIQNDMKEKGVREMKHNTRERGE